MLYSNSMGRKPSKPRDSFGAWLKYLRDERGISQEEAGRQLAHKLGQDHFAAGNFSMWETEGNLAGRHLIPALADVLGVSVETLLRIQRQKDGQYSPTRLRAESKETIRDRKLKEKHFTHNRLPLRENIQKPQGASSKMEPIASENI
jgi:transcriptional regulator with XRE-family HTH domain